MKHNQINDLKIVLKSFSRFVRWIEEKWIEVLLILHPVNQQAKEEIEVLWIGKIGKEISDSLFSFCNYCLKERRLGTFAFVIEYSFSNRFRHIFIYLYRYISNNKL
jgi:hypothetical protein